MKKNAEYYYKSAQRYLLPVQPIEDIEGFLLKFGRKNYYFLGSETPFNNLTSSTIAYNKYATNKVLELAGIPVPKAVVIHCNSSVEKAISGLSFPLVAKPNLGGLGENVLCNIQSLEQLKEHLEFLFSISDWVIIEEFHGGLKSYRVLVHNQKILGLIFREPAYVIGDGSHTIEELITITNQNRQQLNCALKPIVFDKECQLRLTEQKLTLHDIPKQQEKIRLGYTSNASRGGVFEALDTKVMCKENRQLMLNVAKTLNLNLVGLDVECTDIQIPIQTSQGVIIEANHNPSIKIHENPLVGKPTPVTKKILRTFIFKHPFIYLYSLIQTLLTSKKHAFYVRSFVLVAILKSILGAASRLK